jgi:hypothetical protein
MKRKILFTLSLVLLSLVISNATETVRELWDNVGTYQGNGLGWGGYYNGTTSLGFQTNAPWENQSSITSNALIQVDVNFDQYAGFGLPPSHDSLTQGALWSDVFFGANAAIPINSPSNWCARLLVTNSWINFNSNATYYFSADLGHNGDSAGGIAFATGTNVTDRFVGAGITWESYPFLDGTDAGSSDYITTGSFGDPSDTNSSLPEAQGLYDMKAYGATNLVSGNTLLVGQIITTVGGNTTVNIKSYNAATDATLDTNVDTVVWDTSYSFNETNTFKYMVVFMNSESASYPYFQEGDLRVATTWGEVVGVETFMPTVTPTNIVAAGASVTFSNVANLAPLTYQWQTNGVSIPNATNSSYNIASAAVSDSAIYTVVVSNAFGASISQGLSFTVTPPAPPSFTTQPQLPATRYVTANLALAPQIAGSPPFTNQWFHNGSSLSGATNLSLAFTDIQSTNAGAYYLHVSNAVGSTNSVTNLLTVITPTGFDAAVVADQPYGYWQLNETNGTVLHDYFGGFDGSAPDPTNYGGYNAGNNSYGVSGPSFAGFPANKTGIETIQGSLPSWLILPPLSVYSNSMTFVGWVNLEGATYPGADLGVFMSRDPNNGGGYGNAYGLDMADGAGQLGWYWSGLQGPGSPYSTGLVMPTNQWVFVAMVVEPTQITAYLGTNQTSLITDTSSLMNSVAGSLVVPTDTSNIGGLDVGRNEYPYASSGSDTTITAGFSDMAVFYSSLTSQQVLELYAAGVGTEIQASPNGPGSVLLNWLPGATLQSATNVSGPYTDVIGATPPYAVPTTGSEVFYRTRL